MVSPMNGSAVKNPPAMKETRIRSPGRSPGEGNGNPLQYSCLENPMDREDWWATVHGVAKSWRRPSRHDTQRWHAGKNPYSDQEHRFTGAKFTMVNLHDRNATVGKWKFMSQRNNDTVIHWLLLAWSWGYSDLSALSHHLECGANGIFSKNGKK